MSFWNKEHFDLNDSINAEIWTRSPELQLKLQHPTKLTTPGVVGAQQAMLEDQHAQAVDRATGYSVLPWVPDLVGTHWREQDGLMIVGSAYAGFIYEYSSRNNCMQLVEYGRAAKNRDMAAFQEHFLTSVVQADSSYYGPLSKLASPFGDATRMALFDLCRVSFVRRGNRVEGQSDESGDKVSRSSDGMSLFDMYVESAQPAEWLWQRLTGSQAYRIVALGSIAEHGLLRLFKRRGMQIYTSDYPTRRITTIGSGSLGRGQWIREYADSSRTLGTWRNNGMWWIIKGDVAGQQRTWYVLPTAHPSAYAPNNDPGYYKTIEVLQKMMAHFRIS